MLTDGSLSPVCLHALSIENLVMRCVARRLARLARAGPGPEVGFWSLPDVLAVVSSVIGVSREEFHRTSAGME